MMSAIGKTNARTYLAQMKPLNGSASGLKVRQLTGGAWHAPTAICDSAGKPILGRPLMTAKGLMDGGDGHD